MYTCIKCGKKFITEPEDPSYMPSSDYSHIYGNCGNVKGNFCQTKNDEDCNKELQEQKTQEGLNKLHQVNIQCAITLLEEEGYFIKKAN